MEMTFCSRFGSSLSPFKQEMPPKAVSAAWSWRPVLLLAYRPIRTHTFALGSFCGAALLAQLTLGCHRDAEPKGTAAQAAASSTPVLQASAATAPSGLTAQVHLPASLKPGERAPLLVMLHGLGSSGDDIESGSDWSNFAAAHGIAWVAPSGPKDSKGRRFWNAGPTCCNFDGVAVDHVAELRALIEQALATQPLDKTRVFVGGYSNGGFMAHRLACEAPELVSGIVSIAGVGPLEAVTCKAAKSLRVLQIQGDADAIVPYAGGHLFRDPRLPEHASAQKTVADWARRLGCKPTPQGDAAFDFETRLPGAETRPTRFVDCQRGQVQLWTVTGGDHFVGFRAPAPEAIWRFLSE